MSATERTYILRGDTVGLAAPVEEEFVERWRAFNDPDFAMIMSLPTATPIPYAFTLPPYTRAQRQAAWQGVAERLALHFDLCTLDDGRCFGEATIAPVAWPHASGELAMFVFSAEDRGRGLGGEAGTLVVAYAFDVLGLNRMCFRALAMNEAIVRIVMRLAEQLGGRVVGTEHEVAWAYGRHRDSVVIEFLRRNWPPHPATAHLRVDDEDAAVASARALLDGLGRA